MRLFICAFFEVKSFQLIKFHLNTPLFEIGSIFLRGYLLYG